jgi:hypothetical protein
MPAPYPTAPAASGPALVAAAPAPQPVYRKPWFWATVGVVTLTAAVIAVVVAGTHESHTPTPVTTLGDMRAF